MTLEAITETAESIKPSFMERFAIETHTPMIIILLIYLLIILKIGPSYMKSRPAFNLKTYIIVYNILQVITCVYLVYKICVINVPSLQFWKCQSFVDGSVEQRDFSEISILTFWLKVVELSETVVFVLRKKQRQVSFLHVFHHCATLTLVFQFYQSYKSSAALYPLFLNCNVHIFMYCYYLVAAVVPASVVPKLTPFKKAITTIQIIQFVLILIHVITGVSFGCNVPKPLLVSYVCIICAFFYMFYDFYQKNYSTKSHSATTEGKKKRESNKPTAVGH